jgi:soluble lytic murein transglycosylase-like protein
LRPTATQINFALRAALRALLPGAALCLLLALLGASPARADYAVLQSGTRIHVTGYEQVGDRVVLTVEGGTIEIAASDLASIEPEERFRALPADPPDPNIPYGKLIHAAAQKSGINEKVLERVIAQESNFNAKAISRKRALGLMQLMPQTAARYSVRNVFDPEQNINGGTHYLKDLLDRYQGNLVLALAAYNAGPQVVERYGGVPPFAETQNYVRRITSKLPTASLDLPPLPLN